MGRAPCCDKANVKKGPWSPEEDAKLKSYMDQHGTGGNWIALPQKIGLRRCGKSCRLRWLNYLRPNIKHGGFSEEEDHIICSLYISIGSRWSIIAAQLPGRTDNDIKNYWNTRLKKKLLGKQRKAHQPRKGSSCLKQGFIKKGTTDLPHHNPMAYSDTNYNQLVAPYIPEMPVLTTPIVPYSSQEPRFNDHTSIRKLLIKLGGKFSDDDGQPIIPNGSTNLHQFPINNVFPSSQQPFVPSIEMVSSASTDALNPMYNIDEQGMAILSGQCGFQAEFEETMVYDNPQQRLDGMEFLYGDMVISNGTQTTSGESFEWGEMSTLSYPPPMNIISNYQGVQEQGMVQDCSLDELRYDGAH